MAEESKIGQKFKAFIAKEGKVSEDGTSTELNLSALRQFYKSEGVTEEMMKKCAAVDKEVKTGRYIYGVEKIAEAIEAGKKAKMSLEELKAITHDVKISEDNKLNYITITAAKDYSNPANRDETVTHYAAFRERTKETKAIDKDAITFCSEKIQKLLDF